MLTKHFHLTQVCILPFANIERGEWECWHLFCRYYDYNLMFLAFSNTIFSKIGAPESPFEHYMSERILSFTHLMYPSVSGLKALKRVSAICHILFQWKVPEHFWNRIKKIWSVRTKIALIEKNISKEKIRRHCFVVFVLIYPLWKFGGNRTNSLWVLAFHSVRFKKKLIRENSAKYVNQTGNFYFRPKLKTVIPLPIFYLFQLFLDLFYMRAGFLLDYGFNRKIEIWRNYRSEGIL